ncbi:MAG: metallophosphoesterase [Rhodospirillaceae bacterium]|nr:metallophosphoesterase [Rhodospirillaceae bacterium]
MRTLFIGDIHGCAREFEQLLYRLEFQRDTDLLYLTGDAFSRGPDPVYVWKLIQDTGARMVLGNHDYRLAYRLRRHLAGAADPTRTRDSLQTLESLAPCADTLIPWLESLPLWIDEPGFLLVHAGINPEKGFHGTTTEEFLVIRTWPPVDGIVGPRWHDAYNLSGKLIIFGHDAPGGLVIKRRDDGSPYVIGLDSGCIYGGQLSGYVLEEDRLVQVESGHPRSDRPNSGPSTLS